MDDKRKKQLPYLIKLLEDESPVVRNAVIEQLKAYGPSLEIELGHINTELNEFQEKILRDLLFIQSYSSLKESWKYWYEEEDDKKKIEMALQFLSRAIRQEGNQKENLIKRKLDKLADAYMEYHSSPNIFTLASFLFDQEGFQGVPEEKYYAINNSDLLYVLETKEGLPISLVLIYMLVGARCGLEIEGCNYPGHFLARASYWGKVKLIDCFNGGVIFDEETLQERSDFELTQDKIHEKVDAETIILRVLRNLLRASQVQEKKEFEAFIYELMESLELHCQSKLRY